MSKLREKMKRDMELKGFSELTKKAYISHIKLYVNHYMKSPENLGEEDISNYLYFLGKEKGLSRSYNAQAYSALKFLYETTLKQDWRGYRIPRSKQKRTLPKVLSKEEIRRIFNVVSNLKYKTILMTIYSAGLRVSEVANLKVVDIDSKGMKIRVENGKGNKERYTLLGETNYEILKKYWSRYRPKEYLFPGRDENKPISIRSIQKVFETALKKASVKTKASVHTMRHSFASHLLEAGTDIYYIQKLMGHSTVKTTSIYIHVSQIKTLEIKSPLELLHEKESDKKNSKDENKKDGKLDSDIYRYD